jgi:DnaJ-class molecular chaperone
MARVAEFVSGEAHDMPTGPCAPCGGTGVSVQAELVTCAACEGTGKLIRQQCICCDGLGTQEITIKVVCLACDGSGRKPDFPHAV